MMGEIIFTFMLFLTAIAVAAVCFCAWIVYLVCRIIIRLVVGVHRIVSPGDVATSPCPHIRCQQNNPQGALFCRRCGRPLNTATLHVRRSRHRLRARLVNG